MVPTFPNGTWSFLVDSLKNISTMNFQLNVHADFVGRIKDFIYFFRRKSLILSDKMYHRPRNDFITKTIFYPWDISGFQCKQAL